MATTKTKKVKDSDLELVITGFNILQEQVLELKKQVEEKGRMHEEPTTVTVASLKPGDFFTSLDKKMTGMKVRPINFLANSKVMYDVIARGDCLVANTNNGNLFAMTGKTEVTKITL